MDTMKAVCECKKRSEDDLVLAIRQQPIQGWGCLTWIIVMFLVLATAGGALPFILVWVFGGYWLTPTYRCQHCNAKIEKQAFRV